MAKSNKTGQRGVWKKERASITRKSNTESRSNKYRPSSDSSERPVAGTTSQYWRAGYTRKDGTHVKGHYVKKSR